MTTYTLNIKRFSPSEERSSRWQEFSVKMEPMERLLDGLIKIKESADGTLTFRRSCAHGICGSCAMKINGKNGLACQTLIKNMPEKIIVEPLAAYPVIKDLVVEMSHFFAKNEEILPYLINAGTPPEFERLQSREDQEKILQSITCIMCGSCTSSCPTYWADREYLGPAALLKAYRFIFDSRDRAFDERLGRIIHKHGLWRCHSIYNCVESCPKEIDITGHITELKGIAVKNFLLRRKD